MRNTVAIPEQGHPPPENNLIKRLLGSGIRNIRVTDGVCEECKTERDPNFSGASK